MMMDVIKGVPAAERNRGGVTGTLYDVEAEVMRRYGEGANIAETGLCCSTEYDTQYLKPIPQEILEKDYGCGDPSKYVNEGETVVDLGSGYGKICYILAQRVEHTGRVIGVDFNDEMLVLSRKYIDEMADKLEHVGGSVQPVRMWYN